MRGLLLNRYTVVLGAIAVIAIAWNLYVATHNDGRIAGRVVGPDGQAVAGATVTLRERTLTTLEPRATVETDGAGGFAFTGQRIHHFVLEAAKSGVGKSERPPIGWRFAGRTSPWRSRSDFSLEPGGRAPVRRAEGPSVGSRREMVLLTSASGGHGPPGHHARDRRCGRTEIGTSDLGIVAQSKRTLSRCTHSPLSDRPARQLRPAPPGQGRRPHDLDHQARSLSSDRRIVAAPPEAGVNVFVSSFKPLVTAIVRARISNAGLFIVFPPCASHCGMASIAPRSEVQQMGCQETSAQIRCLPA